MKRVTKRVLWMGCCLFLIVSSGIMLHTESVVSTLSSTGLLGYATLITVSVLLLFFMLLRSPKRDVYLGLSGWMGRLIIAGMVIGGWCLFAFSSESGIQGIGFSAVIQASMMIVFSVVYDSVALSSKGKGNRAEEDEPESSYLKSLVMLELYNENSM